LQGVSSIEARGDDAWSFYISSVERTRGAGFQADYVGFHADVLRTSILACVGPDFIGSSVAIAADAVASHEWRVTRPGRP